LHCFFSHIFILTKKYLCIRQVIVCIGFVVFVLHAAFKKRVVLLYQRFERFDDAVDLGPFQISFLNRLSSDRH